MRAAADLVRGQIPARLTTSTEFHGRMLAFDAGLDGRMRMATALGSEPASMRSRTHETLQAIAGLGSKELITTTVLGLVPPGSVVAVNFSEHVQVLTSTTSRGNTGNHTTYTLENELADVYAVGTRIDLVSVPVDVVQGTNVSRTKLLVDSSDIIVAGDKLVSVSRGGVVTYVLDIAEVVQASLVFRFNDRVRYLLEITEPLQDIPAGTKNVHIRANLAYESSDIPLPALSGPYIADVPGGKVFGTGPDNVHLAIALDENRFVGVERNAVAISAPVRAGTFGLLRHQHGRTHVTGEDAVTCEFSNNRWGAGFVLAVAAELVLDLILTTLSQVKLFIEVDGVVETIDLTAGSETLLQRRFTGTSFYFRASGFGNFSISTNPMRDGYASLRYSCVVTRRGDDVWAGGGLLLKPLLPQLRDQLATDEDMSFIDISSGGVIL